MVEIDVLAPAMLLEQVGLFAAAELRARETGVRLPEDDDVPFELLSGRGSA